MKTTTQFKTKVPLNTYIQGILQFFSHTPHLTLLVSHHYSQIPYSEYDLIAGVDCEDEISPNSDSFETANTFFKKHSDKWIFGHWTYDLKNEIEPKLKSEKHNELDFPLLSFYVPKLVITIKNEVLTIICNENDYSAHNIFEQIQKIQKREIILPICSFRNRMSKELYLQSVKALKQHIQRGNIYEITFCREFYTHQNINPVEVFIKISEQIPSPFSTYYKRNHLYALSASPERFLKKQGQKMISQPIKGTYPRSENPERDEQLKQLLKNDKKEQAENVMIVDLVRNDLSRTAVSNSVRVEELFGIYTYPGVHQMISTVVSEIDAVTNHTYVIKSAFPMGSMTGAPKIKAMELIEEFENSYRGLFSGSIGYISPDGNFDFNVIIRTLLYNQNTHYLSLTAGGAITSQSIPENEFNETELKAQRLLQLFQI